jgi:hypothetical protein
MVDAAHTSEKSAGEKSTVPSAIGYALDAAASRNDAWEIVPVPGAYHVVRAEVMAVHAGHVDLSIIGNIGQHREQFIAGVSP